MTVGYPSYPSPSLSHTHTLCSSLAAEIGDYDDMADRDFLRVNKLLPYQDKVQDRIIELHSKHL